MFTLAFIFFFQAEDGIRDLVRSRGLGDVYKRQVQLTPPGSGCSIVIGMGMGADMPPGSLRGLQLVVDDVDAAHAQLVAGGVAVSPVCHYEGATRVEGRGGRWNSFVFFSDPDGNSWAVQERPKGS